MITREYSTLTLKTYIACVPFIAEVGSKDAPVEVKVGGSEATSFLYTDDNLDEIIEFFEQVRAELE